MAVAAIILAGGCAKSVQQSAPVAATAKPATAPAADVPAVASADKVLTPPQPAKAKSAPAAPLAPDTILVKIGDKTITQGNLDKEIKSIEKMMLQRGLSEEQFTAMLASFKPQILDGLVTQTLIDNECVAKKIIVSDKDVKKEIATIEANLPESQTLQAILKRQGITKSMLEEQIQEQLKVEKLLNIKVSDADANKFYDENKARLFETVRARHILIATDPTDDAAQKNIKKAKAEKLRKELAADGDFAKLAEENSDCPSKENGGELIPPFRRGTMAKPFEQVAFNLKPNEISEVVETEFGYHIIQTLELQHQPFDKVKGQILAMLKGRKVQQEIEPLLKSLKEKTKITYLNGATPPPDVKFPPTGGPAPSAL